jgi:DNA helicase IV
VSRTVLVKGLEYDHVIVANVDDITDACNLYVALSRARKTVTILGSRPQILIKATAMRPKQRDKRS